MMMIIHILRQLRRFWVLLLVMPILSALLVVYFTRSMPLEYESEATLYIHLPTNKGLSLTNEEFKQFEIAAYFQNVLELAKSRKNISLVRLYILRDVLNGKSDWIKKSEGFPFSDSLLVVSRIDTLLRYQVVPDVTLPLDAGITIFMENNGLSYAHLTSLFSLNRQGGTDYVRLNTKHSDPFMAAYFSRLILNQLLSQHKSLNRNRIQSDREMFEKLVESAKADLDAKMAKLESYKVKNRIINLPEHTKAIVNQMVDLEVQRAGLLEMLASKERGMEQLKIEIGTGYDLPISLEANDRLVEAKRRLRTLRDRQESASENEIAVNKQQIEELVNQFIVDAPVDLRTTKQDLIQQYISYKVDVEMTRQLIPLVSAELERIQKYASYFAPLESNISTLEREITTAQESYLMLLNKLNLARTVEQGSGDQELVLVDAPNIPLRPKKGKRKLLVIAAFFITGILLVSLIAVIELLDKGLWNTGLVQERFSTHVIGGFPSLEEMATTSDTLLSESLQVIREQQFNAVFHHLERVPESISSIAICAAFENEGRHELARALRNRFLANGKKAVVLDVQRPYSFNKNSVEQEGVLNIVILPPISLYTEWLQWRQKADVFLYTIRAGRTAEFIDDQFYREVSNNKTYTTLFHIPSDKLDDLGMTVQKQRSFVRRWIKKLLHFEFKGKKGMAFS